MKKETEEEVRRRLAAKVIEECLEGTEAGVPAQDGKEALKDVEPVSLCLYCDVTYNANSGRQSYGLGVCQVEEQGDHPGALVVTMGPKDTNLVLSGTQLQSVLAPAYRLLAKKPPPIPSSAELVVGVSAEVQGVGGSFCRARTLSAPIVLAALPKAFLQTGFVPSADKYGREKPLGSVCKDLGKVKAAMQGYDVVPEGATSLTLPYTRGGSGGVKDAALVRDHIGDEGVLSSLVMRNVLRCAAFHYDGQVFCACCAQLRALSADRSILFTGVKEVVYSSGMATPPPKRLSVEEAVLKAHESVRNELHSCLVLAVLGKRLAPLLHRGFGYSPSAIRSIPLEMVEMWVARHPEDLRAPALYNGNFRHRGVVYKLPLSTIKKMCKDKALWEGEGAQETCESLLKLVTLSMKVERIAIKKEDNNN